MIYQEVTLLTDGVFLILPPAVFIVPIRLAATKYIVLQVNSADNRTLLLFL